MRYRSCPQEKVARNYGGSKLRGPHSVPTHANLPVKIIMSKLIPSLSPLGADIYLYTAIQ